MLPTRFRKLWGDQDFADVTLATVDDQQIRAHKVILSSSSQFFINIFLNNSHNNPLLYLKGIRYKELALIVKFIYLGQCELRQYEFVRLFSYRKWSEAGITEYVNLKDIEEPVVENGTNTQEHQEPDSNQADLDDKTWVKSNQMNESEVIIPSNQNNGGRFVCSECKAGFVTTSGLLYHKRSKHEGVKYECDQCDHSYNDNSNLTRHKKSKHEGVRYECDQCDYKSTQQVDLTTHKKSKHEGVKYECKQCDYKANYQVNLTKHKQSIHEGGVVWMW